jgi:aspartyl/asparaginyl-tRNA synthetase
MIEPEIAFADLSDNAALAEALLKYRVIPFVISVVHKIDQFSLHTAARLSWRQVAWSDRPRWS